MPSQCQLERNGSGWSRRKDARAKPKSSKSEILPLALDAQGLRHRLHDAFAKVIGAGRSLNQAAAALTDCAAYAVDARSAETDQSKKAPDNVVPTGKQYSAQFAELSSLSADSKRESPQTVMETHRNQGFSPNDTITSVKSSVRSSPSQMVEMGLRHALAAQSPDMILGREAPTRYREVSKQIDTGDEEAEVQDFLFHSAMHGQLSPFQVSDSFEFTALDSQIAMTKKTRHRKGLNLPPMQQWLEQKISQVDRSKAECSSEHRAVKRAKAISSKGDMTEAEMFNELYLRQQFPSAVLRGDIDAVEDTRRIEERARAQARKDTYQELRNMNRSNAHGWRESQSAGERSKSSNAAQLARRSKEDHADADQVSDVGSTSINPSTQRGSLVRPKANGGHNSNKADHAKASDAHVVKNWTDFLKPKTALKTRLKMLQQLTKEKKDGSRSSGRYTRNMSLLRNATGAQESKGEAQNIIASLKPVDLYNLKNTFARYDSNDSKKLQVTHLRDALKDLGLFPRTIEEKQMVTSLLCDIHGSLSFEEFVVQTKRVREGIMDVQRPQLEFHFYGAVDLKNSLFDRSKIPEMFGVVGCKLMQGSSEYEEVEKYFQHFNPTLSKDISEACMLQKDFEAFQVLFQQMLEKLCSKQRGLERQVKQDTGLNDSLFAEFRIELVPLYGEFQHYDQDRSGFLEEKEIMSLLADFGILNNQRRSAQKIEQIIHDARRMHRNSTGGTNNNTMLSRVSNAAANNMLQSRRSVSKDVSAPQLDRPGSKEPNPPSNPPEIGVLLGNVPKAKAAPTTPTEKRASFSKVNSHGKRSSTGPNSPSAGNSDHMDATEAVHFNFSEFLLLIKRVRKMNEEILDNELISLFTRYDQDHSGELDMKEVSILLADLGLQPRVKSEQDSIMLILQEVDEDGSNTYSLQEFKVLVSKIRESKTQTFRNAQKEYAMELGNDVTQYKEMLRLFAELDTEATGSLGPNDIRTLLIRCRKKFSEAAISEWFNVVDQDGSGFVEFPEFLRLMAMLEKNGDAPKFTHLRF